MTQAQLKTVIKQTDAAYFLARKDYLGAWAYLRGEGYRCTQAELKRAAGKR